MDRDISAYVGTAATLCSDVFPLVLHYTRVAPSSTLTVFGVRELREIRGRFADSVADAVSQTISIERLALLESLNRTHTGIAQSPIATSTRILAWLILIPHLG
ncbi:hypothetical protein PENTCL1PPCAC_23354, partial [Pristionchus entomophagus]